MSIPIVPIIGRQNVGKSTLLNRLAGKRIAIVEDLPGTTRDRIFVRVSWQGTEFTAIDTGGLEMKPESTISKSVKEQVDIAITEGDIVIFLVDVKAGITPADIEIAAMLRKTNKPVILAVNKVDNDELEDEALEFHNMGIGEPLPISAYHGRGTAELLDKIVSIIPPSPVKEELESMKVAIVGRPGVGKSTLLNTLLGEQRAIVDKVPGTTRDSLDTPLDFEGQNVLLIDTAGIRRKGKIETGIEQYSVVRALQAIDRSDVALLLIDASELVTAQDTHIAGYIEQAGKGIIIVVNKWDLVANKKTIDYNAYIASHFKFVAYAPVLYVSAQFGQEVDKILPQAKKVEQERRRRVPTSTLNSVVQKAVAAQNPPRKGYKQLKLLYATQADINPPTFVFFVNDAKLVHFSYQRHLENKLRQAFGFTGTPCRLIFKTRDES